MIADAREIWAYFAPQISETTFAGILARVNGRKLISILDVRGVCFFIEMLFRRD